VKVPPESDSHPHHARAAAKRSKRRKRNLIVLGTAAVVAAYSAGYVKTADAANRMAAEEMFHGGDPVRIAQLDRALQNLDASATTRPRSEAETLLSPANARATQSPLPLATTANAAPLPLPRSEAQTQQPVAAKLPSGDGSPANAVATQSTTETPAKKYKDGAWYGWGSCRHGDLKVIIEIKDDVITACRIDECYTRYSKSVISRLPPRVLERQSANVDWISGATQSSDAFYYAVTEALKAAKL